MDNNLYVVTDCESDDPNVEENENVTAHGPYTLGEAQAFVAAVNYVNDDMVSVKGIYQTDSEERAVRRAIDGEEGDFDLYSE